MAWVITRDEGAQGVAEPDVQNPVVTLTVDTRYRFVNHSTLTIHPFAIRGKDGVPVLGQPSDDCPFELDPELAFEADDQGVTLYAHRSAGGGRENVLLHRASQTADGG